MGRRMVLGNFRARSSPAQNGQRHRVAPSPSGPAWRTIRQRARRLNVRLVLELHRLGRASGRHGQVAELVRQQVRVELTVEEEGVAGERPDAALMGDGLEGLVDAGLGQLVMGGAGWHRL